MPTKPTVDYNGMNVHVGGLLTMDAIALPDSSIGNEAFDPADPLDSSRVEQQINQIVRKDSGVALATFTTPLWLARGDGTVIGLRAMVLVAAVGGSTTTMVVKKNGVSILSATFQIVAGTGVAPLLASMDPALVDYAADDLFTLEVTVAGGGTAPQGFLLQFVARETSG